MEETAKVENEKQQILQEILTENPNEEDDDDGFDEEHGEDGC